MELSYQHLAGIHQHFRLPKVTKLNTVFTNRERHLVIHETETVIRIVYVNNSSEIQMIWEISENMLQASYLSLGLCKNVLKKMKIENKESFKK